jgi:hypothetical protein
VRRVAVTCLAATLGLLGSPGARAAEQAGRITLSGTGSRYAEVTLRARTVLFFDNFFDNHDALTTETSGDYAGFVVETADRTHRVLGGAVLVRGFRTRVGDGWPSELTLTNTAEITLAPGRYRFVLLADRSATVRIRTKQGVKGTLALRAMRAVGGVRALRAAASDNAVPGRAGVGMTRVPLPRPESGLSVAAFFISVGAGPDYLEACVRMPSDPMTPCGDGGSSVGREGSTMATMYHTSESLRGDRVVDWTDAVAGPDVRDRIAFVLTIDGVTADAV